MDVIERIKQEKAFVGNAMHIPRAAQEKARKLCWQFNNFFISGGSAYAAFGESFPKPALTG